MQRVDLPIVICAVLNADPTFVQIKFEQRSDSVVRMDIRTDLAEIVEVEVKRLIFMGAVGIYNEIEIGSNK